MPMAATNLRPNLHPDVIKLGLVSFLTDVSSEMVFSVFAIFFTTIAGGSTALLGLIEGLADFSASSLNYLAGWLSDRSGQRKVFTLAGYAFSTLAKTILLVSTSIAGLGAFRVVERLGKGFRGPPRDAWLTSIADPATRGFSFGVHKALDKAGAVVGPLVAYGFKRQGLGRLLLRKMIEFLARRGTRRMTGDVLRENAAMRALARSQGLEVNAAASDADALRFVLTLPERLDTTPTAAPSPR